MARRKKIDELEEVQEGVINPVKKYVSTRVQQFHPFQRVVIPTGHPGVILEMDSWLDCQIKAGLVKEV